MKPQTYLYNKENFAGETFKRRAVEPKRLRKLVQIRSKKCTLMCIENGGVWSWELSR